MDNIFTDKEKRPTPAMIKKQCSSGVALEEIDGLFDQAAREWKFYGKKYGWNYKVKNKKRALLYLVFYPDHILAGMTVNLEDKDTLLASRVAADVKEQLIHGKKIMEGHPIQLKIRNQKDLAKLRNVLGKVGRLQ